MESKGLLKELAELAAAQGGAAAGASPRAMLEAHLKRSPRAAQSKAAADADANAAEGNEGPEERVGRTVQLKKFSPFIFKSSDE
jgi:hypothetical protein